MTEFSGSLQSFGFVSVLRVLANGAKTGRVRLTQDGWSGEVFMDQGQVVAASFGMAAGLGAGPSGILVGIDALEAMALVLPNAAFFFAEGARAAGHNVKVAAAELHPRLQSLQQEFLRSEVQLISLTTVPRRLDPVESPIEDEEISIDRAKLRLLLAINGRRSVADLVVGSTLLHTLRDLNWLASQGLIQLQS